MLLVWNHCLLRTAALKIAMKKMGFIWLSSCVPLSVSLCFLFCFVLVVSSLNTDKIWVVVESVNF